MMKKATKTAKDKKSVIQNNDTLIDSQNLTTNDSKEQFEREMDIKSENIEDNTDNDEKRAESEHSILESKLEEAESKSREWQDKYIRLSAEFDNYRKRTLKEKADLIKLANEDLLIKILSVVDDFERGMDNIDKSEDVDALRTGVHLIYGKFTDFIKQNGVKEIEAKNQTFDFDYHEAITKIPSPSDDLKGKVVDVIEKGYILNDKVIRYAKVVVGE